MHGGDRNRTSPFAFTGNKFEFRALGSSMSLSFPNTVLNTIVAASIDDLARELAEGLASGQELEAALRPILKRVYSENKQIVFGGDNYSAEWHEEAERRGLLNLKATPDAVPYIIKDEIISLFSGYGVLSHRELDSRYEVLLEQYVTKINIEAETAAAMARTMILPAAARHIAMLRAAGLNTPMSEAESLAADLSAAIKGLEEANRAENHPEDDVLEHARYTHNSLIPAMDSVRSAADALERVVADDLWPLPKYSEILFIK
jgi:glutamine synthetase